MIFTLVIDVIGLYSFIKIRLGHLFNQGYRFEFKCSGHKAFSNGPLYYMGITFNVIWNMLFVWVFLLDV